MRRPTVLSILDGAWYRCWDCPGKPIREVAPGDDPGEAFRAHYAREHPGLS